MATAEQPEPVREAQLNAIDELLRPPLMTKADVAPLFEIPAGTLAKVDVDHLGSLLESLAEFPKGDGIRIGRQRVGDVDEGGLADRLRSWCANVSQQDEQGRSG
jgi:hypothetical protein